MAELTQERLRELLHYDLGTGIFRWRISTGRKIKAGSVAGSRMGNGYIHIGIDSRKYQAHRLAWLYVNGEWPSKDIDHKNNVKDDNRIGNLRLATMSQNIANARRRSDNTSGFKGVSWKKRDSKWCARIRDGNKYRHLGLFTDPADAAKAYDAAAIELHGEFARLNFPTCPSEPTTPT